MVKKSSFSACTRSSDPMAKSDASSSSAANCPHDHQNSPSTQNDVPAEGGASASSTVPSTSSASVTMSALIKAACEDAKNVKLDELINHISELLEKKKLDKKEKRRRWDNKIQTPNPLPTTSAGFSKLREFLSKGIDCIFAWKDKFPSQEAKKVAQDVINGIGQVHFAVAGLLLITNILERMESLSENEARRLILLDEMFELAKHIKELNARPQLREAMEETNKKGTELIMEASLMCCYQINRSELNKVFSTAVDKSELVEFEGKLQRISTEIQLKINIFHVHATIDVKDTILDAIKDVKDTILEGSKVHPPKPRERPYPENAVGIEKPLKKVMELLEWESKESAVAVILHGVGGMGKTTLAEAVFAQVHIEGCRFSKVILDDATSTRDIVKLQKVIIKDLKIGEEIPDIRTFEGREGEGILDLETTGHGQRQIGQLLETDVVFLYIDNVSKRYLLEQLLPSRNLEKAKKLRVLITTRYENVKNGCPRGMKRKVHKMIGLEREEGSRLFYDNIYNDNIYNVTDGIKGQLDKIIHSCSGIPILLKTIARSISSENDIDRVMEDIKGWKGVTFEEIDECLLSYIPNEFKEEFLDICCYFKGWEWETVANIVGISALEMLANRALISKDKNMTLSVHDVILDMGKKEAMNTRFELTSATQIQIQQFLGKEREDMEVIKGLMFGHQLLPARKLNLMHRSLRIFAHKGGVDGHSEIFFEKLFFYKGEAPHYPFAWWKLTGLRFLNCQPQNLNLLKEIPPTLRHIELDGSLCSDVSEISSSDIQRLKDLRVLRLINFKKWKNLAVEWGADVIESLKELTLSNCTSIEQLTGSISMLKNLKILNLEHCWNLKQLPDDFGSLSSLEILKFSHCYFLEELPRSISELKKLKIMTMNFCNIRRLPKECESLSSSLKELNLRNCPSLKALPRSLGNALDLESRRVFECTGVLSDSPQSESDSDYESDTD